MLFYDAVQVWANTCAEKARCALPFAPGLLFDGRSQQTAAGQTPCLPGFIAMSVPSERNLRRNKKCLGFKAFWLACKRRVELLGPVRGLFIPNPSLSLQDGMPSAAAVVGRLIVAAPIIVIEHKVFALMSDSFGDTSKFARMLRDHKRARI